MSNAVYVRAASNREAIDLLKSMLGEGADYSIINAYRMHNGIEYPVSFEESFEVRATIVAKATVTTKKKPLRGPDGRFIRATMTPHVCETVAVSNEEVSGAVNAANEVVMHRVEARIAPKGVRATVTPKVVRATVTPRVTATVTPRVTATVTPRVTATVTPRVTATVTPRNPNQPTARCYVNNSDGTREPIGVNDPIPHEGQTVQEARNAVRERAQTIAPNTVRATVTPRTVSAVITPRGVRATITPKR